MGMFDDIRIYGEDCALYTCAAGHQVNDFQTKDLGEAQSFFVIGNGYIYATAPSSTVILPPHADKPLLSTLRSDTLLDAATHAGTFSMYTHCNTCLPVYTRSKSRDFMTGMPIGPHQPWVELLIETEIGTGRIVGITRHGADQSREALREQLTKARIPTLPDDHPWVVRLHKAAQKGQTVTAEDLFDDDEEVDEVAP